VPFFYSKSCNFPFPFWVKSTTTASLPNFTCYSKAGLFSHTDILAGFEYSRNGASQGFCNCCSLFWKILPPNSLLASSYLPPASLYSNISFSLRVSSTTGWIFQESDTRQVKCVGIYREKHLWRLINSELAWREREGMTSGEVPRTDVLFKQEQPVLPLGHLAFCYISTMVNCCPLCVKVFPQFSLDKVSLIILLST
jgi:hypothetical protein